MPQLTVDMNAAARVLKLLGDPTRLTILAIFKQARVLCVRAARSVCGKPAGDQPAFA